MNVDRPSPPSSLWLLTSKLDPESDGAPPVRLRRGVIATTGVWTVTVGGAVLPAETLDGTLTVGTGVFVLTTGGWALILGAGA